MAAFSFIYASPYFQRSENKSLDATTTKITLKKDNTGDFSPQNLFKLADAEKILGEKAHLKDSTSKEEIQQFQFKSTFTVDTKEAATQKIGNVYFMFEDYNQEGDAQKKYNERTKSYSFNSCN